MLFIRDNSCFQITDVNFDYGKQQINLLEKYYAAIKIDEAKESGLGSGKQKLGSKKQCHVLTTETV